MGIFKKTVKYSKASKDLDSKIKNLDEGLKKTGVISEQNDTDTFCVEENIEENIPKIADNVEVVKEEQYLYNWRETLLESNHEESPEELQEVHSLVKVENYISESNKDLILLRDQIFKEISEETLLNLPEIKTKISKVLEIYEQLEEGLLNEPPEVKNEDPLTPLNQNFVTLEDLNRHYSLFINRVQEQLGTIGGGGETQLKYLDDIVGIATNASAYDGKFLKYDHSQSKFVFETVSSGVVGSAGTWAVDIVGINTTKSVGIGTTAKSGYKLYVEGDTRITGILTIGQGTITLNGNTNVINVGAGITLYGNSGIVSATALYVNGQQLVGTQGTQGVQGTTGTQGIQGTQGTTGTQGITGSGTQGTTGTQGIQGTQGTTGIQGITGSGTQGTTGTQGVTGIQGTQGIQGITGTQGTTGTGTQGVQGIQGPSGGGGGGGGETLDQTLALGNTSSRGMSVGVLTATSLNITGVSTLGISSASSIFVSGISTFAGISTVTGSTLFTRQLNVSGVSTFSGITTVSGSTLFSSQISVSGVSTFAGITTVTGSTLFTRQLNVSGVSTFVSGPVIIGAATSTGTVSQPLQITGGAYISGSVGVGTTNPRENLDVIGSIGVQASGATNRFEIVHNTSLNSLDFIFV